MPQYIDPFESDHIAHDSTRTFNRSFVNKKGTNAQTFSGVIGSSRSNPVRAVSRSGVRTLRNKNAGKGRQSLVAQKNARKQRKEMTARNILMQSSLVNQMSAEQSHLKHIDNQRLKAKSRMGATNQSSTIVHTALNHEIAKPQFFRPDEAQVRKTEGLYATEEELAMGYLESDPSLTPGYRATYLDEDHPHVETLRRFEKSMTTKLQEEQKTAPEVIGDRKPSRRGAGRFAPQRAGNNFLYHH